MNRPLGLTSLGSAAIVLGMLGAVVGFCYTAIGVMGICNGAFTVSGSAGNPPTTAGMVATSLSLIGVLAALGLVALGVGILQLRLWAWLSAATLSFLLFLAGASDLIYQAIAHATRPRYDIWSIVAVVAGSAILAYLLASPVRAAFGLGRDASTAMQTAHAA